MTALPTRFTVIDGAAGPATGESPLRVLLVTEGTYPYAWGGVSTWCDSLLSVLTDVCFHIVSIVAAPDMPVRFEVPPNVRSVSTVPLWGVQDVKETWPGLGAMALRRSRSSATNEAIEEDFLPALRGFLLGILDTNCDAPAVVAHVHAIYRFLRTNDLRETMRSPLVWETYVQSVQEVYEVASHELLLPELELWELTTGMQWVTRWLFPLAEEIPEVDVVHAAMAGICTIVSVAAVREHGAGFLLTEHGVYLRERYIAETSRQDSFFLKLLGLRFARRMTELAYTLADQISPCCDYNSRWEREVGAESHQLETIYYGVDSDVFSADRPVSANPRTVVWVGRINPLKDLETLLRAAAETIQRRPDVQFLLYGDADIEDQAYLQICLDLHEELGLGDSVKFCGFTDNPAEAFLSGDLVVLSSISEGFPYSTLEAMLCGRPIVATSVGGLPEQIKGAGTVVEPRNPVALAVAILDILDNPEHCLALGRAARERAMGEFGHSKFRSRHHTSYLTLSPRHRRWQTFRPSPRPMTVPGPRELLPAVLPEQPSVTEVLAEMAQVDLALDVLGRTPVPMDPLEVAAVIESIGVTDGLARRRYGESDVFTLATTLYEALSIDRKARGPAERVRQLFEVHRRGGGIFDAARYPAWALLPSLTLLVTAWAMTTLGHWDRNRAVALTIGMTSGMLCTNGIALAMGRRASVSLSLGKIAAARRFFVGCVAVGVLWTATIAVSASFLPWGAIAFLHSDRLEFVLTALVVAVVWVTASALSLVAAAGWSGVALSSGLGITAAVNHLTLHQTQHHLAYGTAAGVTVALLSMFIVLDVHARRLARVRLHGRQRLPSLGYLMVEGLPYFVYGSLAVVMLVSIHAVGWSYLDGDRARVATLEVGLFLPLLPAVLAAGRAERSLRAFWEYAGELQHLTPAANRENFGEGLHRRFLRELGSFIAGITANSVLTAGVIELLLRTRLLDRLVSYGSAHDVRILYAAGLLGYALMSVGQFNAMFSLSFLRLGRPLRSMLAGIVVTVGASLYLCENYSYDLLGAALALGSLVYALDSFTAVRPLLASADRHYVAAV
jgi:glycosyltransferase involved in cell wall biosynthesis